MPFRHLLWAKVRVFCTKVKMIKFSSISIFNEHPINIIKSFFFAFGWFQLDSGSPNGHLLMSRQGIWIVRTENVHPS